MIRKSDDHLGMKRASSEASFPVVLSYGRLDRLLADEVDNENSIIATRRKNQADSLQRKYRVAWTIHFLFVFIAILKGFIDNPGGTKKYIPVAIPPEGDSYSHCRKLFANVMASSRNETEALICCPSESSICPSQTPALTARLGHPIPALVLPLIPLILRMGFHLYHAVVDHLPFDYTTMKRLAGYILVMLIRGLVLYWSLNVIEDSMVEKKSNCWYTGLLKRPEQTCYGRQFDFSDHIVLYYAQILPLLAMESFYTLLQSPFWKYHSSMLVPKTCLTQRGPPKPPRDSWQPWAWVIGLLYIYKTVWEATYITAAWFHTPGEVLVGFFVSLLLAAPLALLQCGSHPLLRRASDHFFGEHQPID